MRLGCLPRRCYKSWQRSKRQHEPRHNRLPSGAETSCVVLTIADCDTSRMGLIRKSLAVGTLGVVKGSSKKQRVAKATMESSAAAAQAVAATDPRWYVGSRRRSAAATEFFAAYQQLANARANAQAGAATAAAAAVATRLAEKQAEEEREFRYATDPVYRKFIDDKRAAEEAAEEVERIAETGRAAEATRLRLERNRARWYGSPTLSQTRNGTG